MVFTEVTREMLRKTAWKKSVTPKSEVIEKSEQDDSDSEK